MCRKNRRAGQQIAVKFLRFSSLVMQKILWNIGYMIQAVYDDKKQPKYVLVERI